MGTLYPGCLLESWPFYMIRIGEEGRRGGFSGCVVIRELLKFRRVILF